MVHVLLNKDERIDSVLEVNLGEHHTWDIDPDEGRHLVSVDSVDFDPDHNLYDYRYDPETGEFVYDPPEETVEYLDLATGETKSLTSEDIDAMVDEKVRNQVEAVLSEMAAAAKVEPSVILSGAESVITM